MSAPRLHLVTHTHWDREWYKSAEAFRVHLLPLVHDVLARRGPFLLDGQSVVVEDAMAWSPGLREPLSEALRAGWIEAGPWFVLADNAIPGGEALVRNLSIGIALTGTFGAVAPTVLYCPDTFGHPAAGPTLAAGFGLPLAIVWRGYGGRLWPQGDTARWRNAAGDEVLLHHLPPSGYEFGSSLPTTREHMQSRWDVLRDVLVPRSLTGELLLLNGADHHAVQPGLDAAIRALEEVVAPASIVRDGLQGFAHALVERTAARALGVATGELRASPDYVWTLPGTTASRAAQKRANAHAERLLTREVEPWLAMSGWAGDAIGEDALDAIWRLVLRNHPHDTLCGCSIDAVAQAMDDRLRRASSAARELRTFALGARGERRAQGGASTLLVTNPAPRLRRGVVEASIDVPLGPVAIGFGSAGRTPPPREGPPVSLWNGRPVPMQALTQERAFVRDESPERYPRTALVERRRVLLFLEDLAPLGAHVLEVREEARAPRVRRPVRCNALTLDNTLIRVWWDEDHGLCCTSGPHTIRDILGFETVGDRGDLYTHSAIPGTMATGRCIRARRTLKGPLRGELTLRFEVAVNGRELDAADGSRISHRDAFSRVEVRVQLDAEARWFRCRLSGDNALEDYRLRALFRTRCAAPRHLADAAFTPIWRNSHAPIPEPGDVEVLPATAPLHRFVSCFAGSGDRGVTVYSDGLGEYEATPDGAIAVTVLRAVGELSRADLPERPGHAGYPARTPDAQSRGPWEATCAVFPHGSAHVATFDSIVAVADEVLVPPTGESIPRMGAARHEGPRLEGAGLQFLGARPGAVPGSIVVRCANVTGATMPGAWAVPGLTRAWRLRLDDQRLGALAVMGERVAFEVPASGVATIELQRLVERVSP